MSIDPTTPSPSPSVLTEAETVATEVETAVKRKLSVIATEIEANILNFNAHKSSLLFVQDRLKKLYSEYNEAKNDMENFFQEVESTPTHIFEWLKSKL
jgi:5'-deoxynucleotidase YfbR-like HD superfamily hydrolase